MRYSPNLTERLMQSIRCFAANVRAGRRAALSLLAVFLLSASAFATYYIVAPPREAAVSSTVVISQVYGGGGNTGATYRNDFIELFNRGNTTVSLNGWSVQYTSATGTGNFSSNVTTLPNVSLSPGQYFLVQEASGGANGSLLPTPDVSTGAINMSGTAGKVILANVATGIACNGGSTPCSAAQLAQIVDLVGFGNANFFEGAAAAPTLSNTTAAIRGNNGCTETDNNSADFAAATPTPRNTATTLNPCGGPVNAPVIPTCPGSLTTTSGSETSGNASATDADGTVTGASITNITPSNPGTITLNGFTAAGGVGGTAMATLNVSNATPVGTYTVTITWSNNDATPQTATCNVTVNVNPAGITLIHDIQGNTETPNFAGQTVMIQGIVVGDFQGASAAGLSGFFVEEEQGDWDADPNTSEGMFVFDGSTPATAVSVGDKVTVTGTVLNFGGPPGLTELSPTVSVVVNSTGNTLPPAQTVSLPVGISPAADLEKFEGMRVQFAQTLYVTDNADLGAFGELSLAAASPLYIPTNSIDPNDNPASGNTITGNSNVAAVTAQQTLNNNSRIILDDGRGGSNPNPIAFIGAGTNATIRNGDSVANLAGVMSYGFGSYRIEPTGSVSFNALNPRTASPSSVGSSTLRVASFNVENYFITTNPASGYRGPNNAAELMRKRDKVVAALAGLNADVIGLIELEKATTNGSAAADLAAALTTAMGGGANTYAAIADPATLVGTDPDIKSGIIYRTSAVTPVGGVINDLAAPAGAYSRDPIAQTFQQISNGQKFTLVVNHFRSKTCPGTGDDADLGDGQACFNGRRRSQAQAVLNFINNTLLPIDPDVLVVGDLNSYAQEDPVDVFRGAGFNDVLNQYVAAPSQYSFTFNGELGRLDHAFATGSLNGQITGATIWHINADEPDVFDYNTENKPDDRYAPTPFRSADHDPLVIGLQLACPVITVTAPAVNTGTAGTAFSQTFTQTGGGGTVTFSTASALPTGVTLAANGTLAGTPTQTGSFPITVTATDGSNCMGSVNYTLTINCQTITVTAPVTNTGTAGTAFSQTFTQSGGIGTTTFSTASTLPTGLSLSGAGVLSGTSTQTGTFPITVKATDANGCMGTAGYTLTIGCQTITLAPNTLPAGTTNNPYSQTISQTGGIGTVNFTVSAGTLPDGLMLAANGALSGTPTATGSFTFTVRATDANGCMGTQQYTVAVGCPIITINPATISGAFRGAAYSQKFIAAGGIGAITWIVSGGTLPTGLTLSPAGVLSGTPAATGSFTFTVKATDANNCAGTQTYTVAVHAETAGIADPLACTGPGNAVSVTATVTNNAATGQPANFTATLTATLKALPGTCTANVGTCTVVNASTITWTGNLNAGQTVTIQYQAQVNDGVLPGTQLCATSVATVGNSVPASVTACGTVNCPVVGPGALPQAASPMSDQKAGSVLIYNIYTSAINPIQQNTRIALTNTHPTIPAFVHMYFVDGESCAVADSFLCLTGNQTVSFLASDLDPGTTGFIVAVAVDRNGCPTNFNYLIGDEFVKFSSGHAANLGAEAISAIAGGLSFCNDASSTATLSFDGVNYDVVPRTLAVDNIPSRADGNDTMLILNRIGGNLGLGTSPLGTLFGILYDDAESAISFSVTGSCQLRGILSSNFPRTAPRFEGFIPAGRTGWMKIYSQPPTETGLTGAVINFNPNASAGSGAYNQGHNLHKLTNSSAMSYIIPVFPPNC